MVAVDSTGFETHHVSDYYGKRCGRKMKHFPKLSAVCDILSHLFIAVLVDQGPSWDGKQFRRVVLDAHQAQPFAHLVADAGYDSEVHHGMVRLRLGARTTIKPRRAPQHRKDIRGEYRREMHEAFDKKAYGQRWQIESAFSQCKRRLGSALSTRNPWAQRREVEMRILAHDLMILLRPLLFSTEQVCFAKAIQTAPSAAPRDPAP
jgi:transposase